MRARPNCPAPARSGPRSRRRRAAYAGAVTRFTVAQVTPYPWEQHHEVNEFVERLSDRLCALGRRVWVVAPADARELVREGRAKVKASRSDPDAVFAEEGC